MTFRLLSVVALISLAAQAHAASSIDPEYKDTDGIDRLASVLKMNGALQLDTTAVEAGANEWTIEVETHTLSGTTTKAVDAAYARLLKVEKSKILAELNQAYNYDSNVKIEELTQEALDQLNENQYASSLVQEGNDHEKVRKWLLEEALTKAGRANAEFKLRKKYDFFRYHWHDQNSEVVGKDLLIIRGVKKVIIVRIDYVHA